MKNDITLQLLLFSVENFKYCETHQRKKGNSVTTEIAKYILDELVLKVEENGAKTFFATMINSSALMAFLLATDTKGRVWNKAGCAN